MFGLAKKPFLALRICGTKAHKLILRWGMDYKVMKVYTLEVV